jgi:hypothetical protein
MNTEINTLLTKIDKSQFPPALRKEYITSIGYLSGLVEKVKTLGRLYRKDGTLTHAQLAALAKYREHLALVTVQVPEKHRGIFDLHAHLIDEINVDVLRNASEG